MHINFTSSYHISSIVSLSRILLRRSRVRLYPPSAQAVNNRESHFSREMGVAAYGAHSYMHT
jgi:hypothetical protein